ncbi:hypothetical protein [Tenuibacillus multivorans]|nr:hypothetical protein [Tenuibacillus multivorans]
MALIVGCQEEKPDEPDELTNTEDEQVEEPEEEPTNEQDTENESNGSEKEENLDDVSEDETNPEPEEDSEEELALTVDEARVIVEENLARSIDIMQQLQQEQDWVGIVEDTVEYHEAVEVTKTYLEETISSHAIDEWAGYYFEEFFIYNHFFAVLQPSSLNTRFDLKEASPNRFTFSFIQLGDEAFNETIQYEVYYLKENNQWKFSGYDVVDFQEPLNLTFEDLKHAYMNGETLERFEGELVEELEHNGEPYIVIDYKHAKKAINVNTGYDESYILNQ